MASRSTGTCGLPRSGMAGCYRAPVFAAQETSLGGRRDPLLSVHRTDFDAQLLQPALDLSGRDDLAVVVGNLPRRIHIPDRLVVHNRPPVKLCGLPGSGTRDVPSAAASCTNLPIAGSSANRQSDASVSWPIRCALAFGQRHHVALVVQALRTRQPRLLVLPRVAPLRQVTLRVAVLRAMRVVLLLGHQAAARIHDYASGSTLSRGVASSRHLSRTAPSLSRMISGGRSISSSLTRICRSVSMPTPLPLAP